MSGYVRLYRDLLDHPAFRNDAEAMAFAWLFARAAWKPARVRYKGHAIALKRGQLAISVRDMAEALDRDKAWIERLFTRLRRETMIETHAETGVNVITICNYSKYQPLSEASKTPSETPEETLARQSQDTEQGREEREEESTPPTPRAGGRRGKVLIPSDWVLPPVADLPPRAKKCAELWTADSYETHGEAFVGYWRSEQKMKADWDGTWANRVVALHAQVMRDQKYGNAAPAAGDTPTKVAVTDQAAYLASLADKPWANGTPRAEQPPQRRRGGGPRPVGDLLARFG